MAMLNFIWKLAASEQRVRLGNIKQIFTAGIKLKQSRRLYKSSYLCALDESTRPYKYLLV
jgi:hypothetical protein